MDVFRETYKEGTTMADFLLAGLVSGLLLVYLVYALLKPEEF
jgi:K+-transporting ATPase KdpF subunit